MVSKPPRFVDLEVGDLLQWTASPTGLPRKISALVIGLQEQITHYVYCDEREWAVPTLCMDEESATKQYLRSETYEFWRNRDTFDLRVIREGQVIYDHSWRRTAPNE